jgi:NADPH:quinone reductase
MGRSDVLDGRRSNAGDQGSRAWRSGSLRLETLPTPAPDPGQALVRVTYSGVNFFDVRQRSGDKPGPLPITLGNEGAGVVEALGPDTVVTGIAPGTRVAWQMQQGSYASHAIVPAEKLVSLPDAIEDSTAAAVMLQGLTAHSLACSAYPIKAGDTCLVHSAAGGLGGLLTQIVTACGARVIGTVSSADKVETARKAGASDVVVRGEQDFAKAVRELTDGRGVDVAYDAIGKDTFHGSLESLRPLGYLILFGQASGPLPPFDTHELAHDGGRFLTQAAVGQYVTNRDQLLARACEVFDWIVRGNLKINIADTYPLADAAAAHSAIGGGTSTGKLLLAIG